jgi:transposase-like protein
MKRINRKSKFRQFSDEEFIQIVQKSEYYIDILRAMGYGDNSGTMYKLIKKRIKELNIDISHIGYRNAKARGGAKGKTKYSLDEILIENSLYKNNTALKKRLLDKGILENKCYDCGLLPFWNGKNLTLQLDHINGINNDNRVENLQILCPNCHTQTHTYGSKNTNNEKYKKRNSEFLGEIVTKPKPKPKPKPKKKPIDPKRHWKVKNRPSKEELSNMMNTMTLVAIGKKYGVSASTIRQWGVKYEIYKPSSDTRKVKNRPSKEELSNMIENMTWVAIGKKYGVSDNAVRKWAKKYKLL